MDNEQIAPVEAQIAPVIAEVPAIPPGYLHKDDVTRIVNDRTSEAYNKGLARGQAAAKAESEPVLSAPVAPAPPVSREDIREMVVQVQQDIKAQEQEAEKDSKVKTVVNTFVDRVTAAEAKYPGISEAVGYLGIGNTEASNALMVGMTAFDNTADILKVLRDDTDKYRRLCDDYHRSPQLFADELTKLSNSIKQHSPHNAQQNLPREPLSQFKSSVSSMGSGNDVHTADASELRRDPRYRC